MRRTSRGDIRREPSPTTEMAARIELRFAIHSESRRSPGIHWQNHVGFTAKLRTRP
jgi:hypothetical protein